MSLENLRTINRLQAHSTDRASVQKLLASARRNLADALITNVSPDNRFDAAYKALMQCAIVGLWANGYRTSTSQPGHHQTALQCLPQTMAVAQATVIVLDALRKQRNINDYEGDPISDAALLSCLDQATQLLAHTEAWLKNHRPDLAVSA